MSRHIVDIEAEASEASRDMDIPDGAKPIRPGRTTVLSVRLGQDEADALAELAATRSVPVSTLARSLIVEALQTGHQPMNVHEEVVRALRETLRSDFLATS